MKEFYTIFERILYGLLTLFVYFCTVIVKITTMRNAFKIILTALLLFSSYTIGIAKLKQINTDNLLVSHGLSSNTVYDIAQDRDGFIWLATPYGLNRFDGIFITKYFADTCQGGPASNMLKCVAADTIHGKVWIGTSFSGISVYDNFTELFQSYSHDPEDKSSLMSDNINDIHVDSFGRVWIATDRGLDLYDYGNDSFDHFSPTTVKNFPRDKVTKITSDNDGNIWIGLHSQGIAMLIPDKREIVCHTFGKTNTTESEIGTVLSLFIDPQGRLWIGSKKGVAIWDNKNHNLINFSSIKGLHHTMYDYIYDIMRSSDGLIWLATTSDLSYFHENDFDKILSNDMEMDYTFIKDYDWGIANPSVYALLEDKFGNLWIGSNGCGGSFYNRSPQMFHSWRINKIPGVTNALNDKEVMSICIVNDSLMLLGTDGGGVNVNINGQNCKTLMPENSDVKAISYGCLTKAHDGKIWMGTRIGIDILDPNNGSISHINPSEDYKHFIKYIMEDSVSHNFWIVWENELLKYDPVSGKSVTYNSTTSALPDASITLTKQDNNGLIWIGTYGFGAYIYDEATGSIYEKKAPVNKHYAVNDFLLDSNGNMWAATNVGLIRFGCDSCEPKVYTDANGLASSMVYSLIADGSENIWMSTNEGISYFIAETEEFLNFDAKDNVLPGPYLPHSSARHNDGTLYFGGMNGVCYCNEADIYKKLPIPQVRFTSLRTLETIGSGIKSVSIPVSSGKVNLSNNQKVFTVTFSVMNKAVAEKVEYSYRMVGLSDNWFNIGHEPQITFHNLPYGKYTLNVRTRLPYYPWSEEYASLIINLQAPPLLSWWAKLIYIVLFLALLGGAYWFRKHVRNLRESHRNMEKQVADAKTLKQNLYTDSINDNDKEFIDKLISCIEARIEDGKIDVNILAEQMNMSYSSLYRRVKSVSNMTLSDFIRKVRIQKAKDLLLKNKYSITEIAEMVGFSSNAYFRDCFKQELGMSPSQWLNSIKEHNNAQEVNTAT